MVTSLIADVFAPPVRHLRSRQYRQELAQFIVNLDHAGDGAFDWVQDEVYTYHRGRILLPTIWSREVSTTEGPSPRWRQLDLDRTRVEEVFGEEPRSWINAFKRSAVEQPKVRLQERCVPRVLFMDVARFVYLARHDLLG